MTTLPQTTWLTFEKKIQQLEEKKLRNNILIEEAGANLLEAICNKNFEEVEKASNIYASLNPKLIDEKIACLREKKAEVALIPSQDPEYQQSILNDDPIYARAQQDSNEALLKAFENRTLTEAEYNAAFSVQSPEMLSYQEQVAPLFETLIQETSPVKEKRVIQLRKNYIPTPQALKRVIKELFPTCEDLKVQDYTQKAKLFNERMPAGKQIPNSIYSLGTYLRKLLHLEDDDEYNIQTIKDLIYGKWYSPKTASEDKNWKLSPQKCGNKFYIKKDGTVCSEEEYKQDIQWKKENT